MANETQAAPATTQSFYDRIADVHNLALKLNGYRSSVAKYLRSLDLEIDAESYVLDAGSGTGIVTLGFQDSGLRPKKTIALDLSLNSLKIAREQFEKEKGIDSANIVEIQGNVLEVPFADETFDLIVTCGVLEYVPLDAGLRREWTEELDAPWEPAFTLVGLLNDDSNPVGAVHLGVVFSVEASGRPVAVRETDKLVGRFATDGELSDAFPRMETWSQLVAAELLEIRAPGS